MRVFLLLNTESRFSVLSVHLLLLYSVKISVSWNDAYPPPPQCLSRLILFLLIWPQLLPLWLLSSEQFYVRQSLNLWTNAFSSAPGWFSASFWMTRETNWQKMPGWPNRPQIWFRELLLNKMAPTCFCFNRNWLPSEIATFSKRVLLWNFINNTSLKHDGRKKQ